MPSGLELTSLPAVDARYFAKLFDSGVMYGSTLPRHISVDVSGRYGNMFWTSGQDILAAARIIAAHPHLQAIYITNFGCGPDSFLLGFFGRLMKEKPFLELEIDEHSADAGVETRCEAFFDSLR